MSLATDSIFTTALQSNSDLMATLGYVAPTLTDKGKPASLYVTAIPLPDEDLDNVHVPYVIVTFDGLTNDQGTKDDRYESRYDRVNIGIEVVGKTLNDLHDLTQMVRDTVLGYFHANQTNVEDYTFTADAIQFDSLKPCYWQVLRYQCDVCNLEDDEQDEG
jgi:hypothetical protein